MTSFWLDKLQFNEFPNYSNIYFYDYNNIFWKLFEYILSLGKHMFLYIWSGLSLIDLTYDPIIRNFMRFWINNFINCSILVVQVSVFEKLQTSVLYNPRFVIKLRFLKDKLHNINYALQVPNSEKVQSSVFYLNLGFMTLYIIYERSHEFFCR